MNEVIELMKGREFKRPIFFEACDINTGEVVVFDNTIDKDLIPLALTSSASIPLFFPPRNMNGKQALIDGGAWENIDFSDAILACKEMGYKDEDIIIDVIMSLDKQRAWPNWTMAESKWKNAYDIYQRSEWFSEFYYYYESVTRTVRGYPNVHFRHLIVPDKDLGGAYIAIYDDVEVNRSYVKQGYEETLVNLKYYFSQ